MQTKKRATGRNSKELASPRVTRQQKKLVENAQVQAKKVTELITSSARKKKVVTVSKEIEEPVGGTNLDTKFRLADVDDSNVCLGYHAEHEFSNSFMDNKDHDNGTANYVSDTIFSPSFHIARGAGGEMSSEEFYKFFHHGNQQFEDRGKENIQIDCPGGGALSPEVSAIYLSMKNSNLECIDENNQDHLSADVCQEDEDAEEYEDFDPYFFIKNLPDLSSVVPAFRPVLLPKQTRSCPSTTLVLDLDETLVHSSLEPCDDADFTFAVNFNLKEHTVYVRCRPHLRNFLERVSRLFEIIIFTASQSIYAEQLLNVLDPKRKIFRHRVYRDSCVFVDGNYLKDLSVLGRDLARVIIIDNSPQAFGFQVDNGIPIESWFDDRSDTELLMLLPFLESLVGVQDVRPLIASKYNLREKIAAAVCPLEYNAGDPFER
ncbi:TFIIF-interacting CTD phosphatase, including NLI-interacting factor [Handroanthus impetiginosus]|uniref:TFIIF-interacting CTD phosphatase, including NLI-interacting factor n=1 Tax=Handroanthus impetiginosus TaxID=429701 RepID=A0A2G9H9M6_9LAMI|nr:TFIIF-interacting CTD phosphatase, including NLI-interacting factor [Handroanthus impetiginosus]PIN14000.1 TFIIF-interacting CTD phosphatase, including NLI-interacting factor [Handroanthus impetiginosus]